MAAEPTAFMNENRLRSIDLRRPDGFSRLLLRCGTSLIELLAVAAIITLLMGLLLPAVQAAREAGRRVQCQSNLHQIGIAVLNYEATHGTLPPSFIASPFGSWSVHARLLPYIEQNSVFDSICFDVGWEHPRNLVSGVPQFVLPAYKCPSDPFAYRMKDEGHDEGWVSPVSYGFNAGTWFIWDPVSHQSGDGVFLPQIFLRLSAISDGLSTTMAACDVKTFQPLIHDTFTPSPRPPSRPEDLLQYIGGGQFELGPDLNDNGGHGEWCDGAVYDTGFTATFPPNYEVEYTHRDGRKYDIDFTSRTLGTSATQPTFAAVTARSYHQGLVHAVGVDGGVHPISDSIDPAVWRKLCTRNGGEVARLAE
ncbi:MAG: DUF1559 domain-containing protein [Planctomycetota bacterium]|nr:MAG: DUF1559 domain-containing protein [Planctomycetota bacterium]